MVSAGSLRGDWLKSGDRFFAEFTLSGANVLRMTVAPRDCHVRLALPAIHTMGIYARNYNPRGTDERDAPQAPEIPTLTIHSAGL